MNFKHILSKTKHTYIYIILIYILYYVNINYDIAAASFINIKIKHILYSMTCWCIANLLTAYFSWQTFLSIGENEKFSNYLISYINRLPAKYLPGGVWQTVSRYIDLKNHGTKPKALFNLFIHETLMPFSFAIFFGIILLNLDIILSLGTLAIGVLFYYLYFYIFKFSTHLIPLSKYRYMLCIVIMLFVWMSIGFSIIFYMIGSGNDYLLNGQFINFAGAYFASWAIGNIAFFAPQGLGITEYSFAYFFSNMNSIPAIIIVLFSFRILIIFSDITLWIIQNTLMFFYKKNEKK